MSLFLGIDTSNYTTSCALYDSETGKVDSVKKLLPVKSGEKGIRQSDAVFHHTKQLPELMQQLLLDKGDVYCVSYSCAPRNAPGSYMPCFLAGECTARCVAAACGAKCYATYHQMGHILAALYSCKRLDLLKSNKSFLAFHISGGTTDRVGLMLGLDFPCGAQLEKLAVKSSGSFTVKPVIRGLDCSLSGIENKCRDMINAGRSAEDTARFCLEYIGGTVRGMTLAAIKEYGEMPVVYAGGVMSDRLIKDMLTPVCDGYFAQPEYSCDNAVGVALYGAIREDALL